MTFLVLGLSQLKQYKDATITFYNFNQALLTEIAEKDNKLTDELNRINNALDKFADTIEKYDPSQEIVFPEKIQLPEQTENLRDSLGDEIEAKINEIIANPRLKRHLHRKFKNYN